MGPDIGSPITAPGILASSDVLEVSVPASGGTDAGTFKAEVDPDVEVDVVWPWPAAWTVTSD